MPQISLRRARAEDGEVVAGIQVAAWRATYLHMNPAIVDGLDLGRTAENWAKAAVDPTHRLRLAVTDGAPVGYAFSGPAKEETTEIGELHALYLLPSAQGLGAGRLLVEDALAGLTQAGYAECVLWVAIENDHARAFYEHLGFHSDDGRDLWRGLPGIRYRRALVTESR